MGRPAKFSDIDVLDRAVDHFWRDGCESVSIRDLEVVLELKAPSIYRRFESKDHLIASCIDRYSERVIGGRIRHFLSEVEDPLQGLHAFFSSALMPHVDELKLRGCLLTNTANAAAGQTPEVRLAVAAGLGTIEASFRSALQRALDQGSLSPETDVVATAKALLMSFQGLLVLVRAGAPGLESYVDAAFTPLSAL